MQQTPLRIAFLDRDGTINVDRGFVHRVKDWEFVPGVIRALKLLRQSGFRIAIVTNQSGIAAGKYTSADVEKLHAFMCQQLASAGAIIDIIAYCPHGPRDECECRKPRTGIARFVESRLGRPIDYVASWVIGDKPSDAEFGRNLGCRCALLRSRYWEECELSRDRPDLIVDSLLEAAERIVGDRMP